MPEGDTIRKLAGRINARFAGQRVTRCVTRDPRLVGVDFTGATLVEADAVGKHLLVRFDDGRTLHAHLHMDGSFLVGPAASRPDWHRRIELWLEDGHLTGLEVPILGVLPTAEEDRVVGHLGPDLCAAEPPDLDEIVARLTDRPDEPLAGALLDQRNVAGFGNVYAVELPFLVGVSPNQPIGSVSGLRELAGLGTALIRVNTARGPRNTTGRRLSQSDHWIYGARRCGLCGAPTQRWTERDSPWRRISTWCPDCQALTEDRAIDVARARKLLALHPARRDPNFPPAPDAAGQDVAPAG